MPNERLVTVVKDWLGRPTGFAFSRKQVEYYRMIKRLLKSGDLKEVTKEGLGGCTCSPEILGNDIRFYLSSTEFFAFCPRCDSWAVYPTRMARRAQGLN